MDFAHVGRRAVEGRCGGGSMTRDGGVMRLGHPTPQSDGVIDADVAGWRGLGVHRGAPWRVEDATIDALNGQSDKAERMHCL
jgi:hypothetical protein